MRLLNPGPVNLTERVRAALARPDICHREPEFAALQSQVRSRLLGVYDLDPGNWSPVLLTGSGTAAVEAMLSSLVPCDGSIVVIENGVYGERLTKIANIHGIAAQPVRHEWTGAIDLERVAATLDRTAGVGHVAVVHHETTTGRLNDLDSLAALCRERGVRLLVDAVSSFGAEAIDFDGWPIEACAAASNKCLHGVPGVSFVLMRSEQPAMNDARPRTMSLDLLAHLAAQKRGGTLFTPAVPAVYALDEALAEMAEAGGQPARRDRYASLARRVRQGMARLDVPMLLPEPASSCVLTAFRLPPRLSYGALHDGLKQRGFIIYAGQGDLSTHLFRIATMGSIDEDDVDRLIAATGEVIGESRPSATSASPVRDGTGG